MKTNGEIRIDIEEFEHISVIDQLALETAVEETVINYLKSKMSPDRDDALNVLATANLIVSNSEPSESNNADGDTEED